MSAVLDKSRPAGATQPESLAKKLYGVMQAPVTPLHQDFSVDYDGFAKMCDFHVRHGAPALAWPHPPGITVQQVAYWDEAVARTIATDEWKKLLDQNSTEGHYLRSRDFSEFLDAEYAVSRAVLTDLGYAKQP